MSFNNKILKNPGLSDNQSTELDFYYSFTSNVGTLLPAGDAGSPIVWGYTAAAPLTTAAIDAFTGNVNDILGDTCFASTSMGTDSMGFVIDMGGQAAKAIALVAVLYDTVTLGTAVAGTATALTDSLSTALCCSPLGNLYGRVVVSGLDAASAKILHLKVICRLK